MKALTYEAGCASPQVEFSRYQLCRTIGWEPDGRAYKRLEESLDRIAATTLKFKDAWWDKGEKEYKSKTFHLITEVEICSRDQLDRKRARTGRSEQRLCSFTWTEVIWKSFEDGFIKTLDMQLFRRIAQGRRREVPLRLFRILDKRFWHAPVARFSLSRLCTGTLGLCPTYSPSQMMRVLERAAKWLVECGYLQDMRCATERGAAVVYFRQRTTPASQANPSVPLPVTVIADDSLKRWLSFQSESFLTAQESVAIECEFGSEFERDVVMSERERGIPLKKSRRIRQEFVRRFAEASQAHINKVA